jgi:ATP-dependent Clp protease ATP-binding subunit ClpA
VFERFTDRARRVVVLAQEEARLLDHNYIGTEHVLLGLIHEGEGVAALALEGLGVSLETVRAQVLQRIGRGEKAADVHIPFTPRAKRVLSLALREALDLGAGYIGTEHLLLGLLREADGVGAQVLNDLGADVGSVRSKVLELVSGHAAGAEGMHVGPEVVRVTRELHASASAVVGAYDPSMGPLCSMCRRPLLETATYKAIEAAEHRGEGFRRFLVLYCGGCGDVVKTELLPEES